MRAITTNWNNSAYASAATFVDKVSGNAVTVPALNPMNHRSMIDSVESGGYIYQPDGLVLDPPWDSEGGPVETEPEDENVYTVTITLDSVPVVGAPVRADSSDPDVISVSPAIGYTNDDGEVDFVVTSVADGGEDVTFACGTINEFVSFSVTTPEPEEE